MNDIFAIGNLVRMSEAAIKKLDWAAEYKKYEPFEIADIKGEEVYLKLTKRQRSVLLAYSNPALVATWQVTLINSTFEKFYDEFFGEE